MKLETCVLSRKTISQAKLEDIRIRHIHTLKPNARHMQVDTKKKLFYEITNRCSYMQSLLFHC